MKTAVVVDMVKDSLEFFNNQRLKAQATAMVGNVKPAHQRSPESGLAAGLCRQFLSTWGCPVPGQNARA